MKKLKLPQDEMAFRKVYLNHLNEQKLTTVFRPEKRLCGDERGYCENQIVKAKIIENIGADWAGIAPEFIANFEKIIKIKSVEAKTLKEFNQQDFIGSSPDVKDIQSLKYHLGIIYNIPLEKLSSDFIITKITFDYI